MALERAKKKHGTRGEDLFLRVPCGTVIRDAETNELIADLVDHEQRAMIARGGRGGLGNVHFATSTRQAPREAQKGEPGEERWLLLELQLIADVGLVGYPNAGKSTLLSVVTAAQPKIADYPFTTLSPNLGVVSIGQPGSGDEFGFVLADIPGLIEGAAQGVGLGHEFLRHVQRTRLLLHILDGASIERDPWEDFQAINQELREYDEHLATRPQIVVLNKMDLPEAQERWPALKAKAEASGYPVFAILPFRIKVPTNSCSILSNALRKFNRKRSNAWPPRPLRAVKVRSSPATGGRFFNSHCERRLYSERETSRASC